MYLYEQTDSLHFQILDSIIELELGMDTTLRAYNVDVDIT